MFQEHYEWVKALHIISIISWMAGMLYLPRLYAYHCRVKQGSETDLLFKTMEKRLLRIIINPAMFVTLITGLILASVALPFKDGWFHGKMLLVFLMLGCHGLLAKYRKDFERDGNKKPEKFYRILNEIPMVLLIGIVLLVVLKPF